jgi:hypothetical protein
MNNFKMGVVISEPRISLFMVPLQKITLLFGLCLGSVIWMLFLDALSGFLVLAICLCGPTAGAQRLPEAGATEVRKL